MNFKIYRRIQLPQILWTLSLCLTVVDFSLAAQPIPYQEPQQNVQDVESLRAILRDPEVRRTDPARLKDAINKIGKTKSAEAIDELIALLTFSEGELYTRPPSVKSTERDDRFIAANALYLIGKPALPALFGLIEKHDEKDLERAIAFSTIVSIFGEDVSGRAEYIRKAMAEASSPEAIQRLARASQEMEKLAEAAKR
ncbi:MAG TPA: hypothetical protein VFV58_30305 [Blastocatellia bacterium]|jgi:hypothetical protein|nr:hypothetical protein [Blastocatellia bacterium]